MSHILVSKPRLPVPKQASKTLDTTMLQPVRPPALRVHKARLVDSSSRVMSQTQRWRSVGLSAVRCSASRLFPSAVSSTLLIQTESSRNVLSNLKHPSVLQPSQKRVQHHHLGSPASHLLPNLKQSYVLQPSQQWLQQHYLGSSGSHSTAQANRLFSSSGGAFSALEEAVARDLVKGNGTIHQTEGGAGSNSTPSTNVDEIAPEGKGTEERSSAVKRALESGQLGFGFSAGGARHERPHKPLSQHM